MKGKTRLRKIRSGGHPVKQCVYPSSSCSLIIDFLLVTLPKKGFERGNESLGKGVP